MGLFKSIGDFLFGKDPNIFDENGRVRHQFPDDKWKKWDSRLKENPAYNWRQHGAKARVENTGADTNKNS